MRWQPRQWHAIVTMGGAVMRMRIRSQRQAAVQGSFQSDIIEMYRADDRVGMRAGIRRPEA
jgi:hypothetical protein